MKAIIVHGGAGKLRKRDPERLKEGVRRAAEVGYRILLDGGSALDACESAVKVLEDDSIFNAGTGSVLTLDGRCEMDALIMKGSTLEVGAVAGVRDIKNPISLARKVMEETDHVLLAGEGAERFAEIMGFEKYNPVTKERIEQWKYMREKALSEGVEFWPKLSKLIKEHPEILHGTVGCVALDDTGEIVAGTSTGGVLLKIFGRIGDTPIPGAGTYASPYGGASATGIGEGIMRTLLAKTVCDLMRAGLSAPMAAQAAIDMAENSVELYVGVIAIDRSGRIGFAYNTEIMSVAFIKDGMDEIEVAGLID